MHLYLYLEYSVIGFLSCWCGVELELSICGRGMMGDYFEYIAYLHIVSGRYIRLTYIYG